MLDRPWRTARPGAVLVLDGIFLHRDELRDLWDLSVFLDVPVEISVARMSARDGSSPDPEHPCLARYIEGQRLYFQACRPWERADMVIDNRDWRHPVVVTGP